MPGTEFRLPASAPQTPNLEHELSSKPGALRLRRIVLASVLAVMTLLLYQPVIHHEFLNYDDNEYVTSNSHVQMGLTLRNVRWAFTSLDVSNWHPLTWISHMADYQLFGPHAGGHHYSNLLLHVVNVVLLFLLLQLATGALWRSFFVAALFAIHPLNIETVAWISERKSLLSTFFSFLAVASYGWYVKGRSISRYLLTCVLFVLALMAKPMAVTLPVILLLLDYWPLRRFSFDESSLPEHSATGVAWSKNLTLLVLEKVPLLLLSALSGCITLIAQKRGGSVAVSDALPLAVRLKNAIVSYVAYIQKTFWPSRLTVFYPHPGNSLSWTKVAFALFVLAAITLAIIKFRRTRYLLTGWLLFLVTLLPVIGIVQAGRQAMADRYAYLPLIGLFIIVVWGVAELTATLAIAPSLKAVAAICVLLALAAVTRAVLPSWQNSLTLFTRARQLAPAPDYQIEELLGEALDSVGRYDEARRHFEAARALNGHDPLAHYDIGTYMLREGRLPDAILEFQTALRYSSDRAVTMSILNNLGLASLLAGDYPEAERDYTEAIDIDSLHYSSLLGRGQALYKEGKYSQAADDFARALAIKPQPAVYLWRGEALEAAGRTDLALATYNEALRQDPGFEEAKSHIASLKARN